MYNYHFRIYSKVQGCHVQRLTNRNELHDMFFFKEIKQTTRKQRARKHQNLTLSAIRRERVGRGWFVEAHLYFL